ncbi:hypothetical protein Megvenef_00824 [Candidatus Megaera venefica]|uniref:Uncharacterized protein n=1 Tax=Candidatus Megaera venefica TaxID=2055910 RepID=A0ABU5NCF6_9RICK|nr:hypothetical protein [Candidatus Megaera venefica]MEA0970855.1 hypothetical protein [Candidatus Megaera venefica]
MKPLVNSGGESFDGGTRELLLQSVSHSSLIHPPFITPSHPFALDSGEGAVEPPSASLPPPLIITPT